MSMIGRFVLASDDEISELLAEPQRIRPFLASRQRDERHSMDVEKAWQALDYLLTAARPDAPGAELLGFILDGGATVGDVDVGYGPWSGDGTASRQEVRDELGERFEELKRFVSTAADGGLGLLTYIN